MSQIHTLLPWPLLSPSRHISQKEKPYLFPLCWLGGSALNTATDGDKQSQHNNSSSLLETLLWLHIYNRIKIHFLTLPSLDSHCLHPSSCPVPSDPLNSHGIPQNNQAYSLFLVFLSSRPSVFRSYSASVWLPFAFGSQLLQSFLQKFSLTIQLPTHLHQPLPSHEFSSIEGMAQLYIIIHLSMASTALHSRTDL